MPAPNQEAVLKALTEFISLGRNVGLAKAVLPLEQYVTAFQTTKPTLKVLQSSVDSLADKAFRVIRDRVYDMANDKPRPGMRKQDEEFTRTFRALKDAIYPPSHPETTIVGLAGNKESTTVIGAPEDAKIIANQSLAIVSRFAKAVFKQDLQLAYELCASEFKKVTSMEQFTAGLAKADKRFGGPAVDLKIERITWIYADAASRKRSNSNGDWPKGTPKPNKRALVGTFWLTDKKQKRGRSAFFWVTEEAEGYRIAKFNQYLQ